MNERELRAWFKQVRKERYEIEHLKELINTAKTGLLPSGIRYDRDKIQTSPDDTMSKVMSKAVDMQRELENSIAELQERHIRTEQLITRLDNSDEREVLRYYYLDSNNGVPLTWEQVAIRMNFAVRHVHRIHDRALVDLVQKGA
jgi:hypothetical protein